MRAATAGSTASGRAPAVSCIRRTSLRAISSSKLGEWSRASIFFPRPVITDDGSNHCTTCTTSSGGTPAPLATLNTSATSAAMPMMYALPHSL